MKTGQAKHQCIPPAIPLWRLLRLRQAKGARVQKHCLDRRMCSPATAGQDRQLHSYHVKSEI